MLVGAILGDFVKGSLPGRFSADITRGILLHRKIDRYTDDHKIMRVSRSLISPERRRFSGIIVDVCYDHFLARHWASYSSVELEDFAGSAYRTLVSYQSEFPERLQHMLPRMMRDDWLSSYRELWAIDAALNGIAQRLRRTNTLKNSVEEIRKNYLLLEEQFLSFFPQLIQFVASERQNLYAISGGNDSIAGKLDNASVVNVKYRDISQ